MKKYIIIFLTIIILGAAVWFYLKDNQLPGIGGEDREVPQGSQQDNQENGINEGILETDEFSVMMPEGWQKSINPPTGAKAMVVNVSEEAASPAVQQIGFKTYFSVGSDSLDEMSLDEYIQLVKGEIAKIDSGVVFSQESQVDINGMDSRAMEIDMSQQGIDFKVLMVVMEKEGKAWGLSFNTTQDKWSEYQDLFTSIVYSFQVK